MHAARSESVTFALGYTHLSDFPTDRLESPRRLIINFLPQNSTDDEVMRIFAPFGRVINLKVIRDKRTRSCLGYGFIEYSTPQEAIVAIEHGNGVQLRNKRLKVWYSRKPAPGMRDSNVYVQNYGEMLEDWQLVDIFSQFGRVINMNMLRDKQGKSRGAAFVRMDSHEEAVQAVNALNGTMIGGKRIFAKIHEAPAVPLHKGGIPCNSNYNRK
ncbi:MAG: hypothetical protein EZS28_011115 [Streblomastix strix]|uniref:RRM domain-containing protein n=1 Tax=Streblomastix strix TaxID=222440 RepID=A0A5J4WG83_9EUKA|nr:MAG: hypothetical protein EZS28_011115 [Streblomastix strix]